MVAGTGTFVSSSLPVPVLHEAQMKRRMKTKSSKEFQNERDQGVYKPELRTLPSEVN